jgi:hypothetical protein
MDAIAPSPQNPDAHPSEGDLTICFGCVNVLVLNADITLRRPTVGELAEIATDPDSQRLVGAIKLLMQQGIANGHDA